MPALRGIMITPSSIDIRRRRSADSAGPEVPGIKAAIAIATNSDLSAEGFRAGIAGSFPTFVCRT